MEHGILQHEDAILWKEVLQFANDCLESYLGRFPLPVVKQRFGAQTADEQIMKSPEIEGNRLRGFFGKGHDTWRAPATRIARDHFVSPALDHARAAAAP